MSVGLRVVIDGDKCLGNARCVAAAPKVFDVDEDGNSMLIVDGAVPDGQAGKVDLAIRSCPTGAISLSVDA